MTAHKSKGLEFDTVYVVNAVDNAWGESARSRGRSISYPENLPLANAGETEDDRLRLFFVAITRAKRQLFISYSSANENAKKTLLANFLLDSSWPTQKINPPSEIQNIIEAAELAWYQPIIELVSADLKQLLAPTLENYKLSVTHLNNFLDITKGGPSSFLMQNLLRFPSAKSANASFGTAIHDTLQKAHDHLVSTGQRQAVEDIVSLFGENLKNQHLAKIDFEHFLEKGSEAIRIYLDAKYDTFSKSDQTELNFGNQHSMVGEAHLSGKLDLVNIDKNTKSIIVTDYKTGKPSSSWTGKDDNEKIKLHKYRQQLMFYKLLVEASRDYSAYRVNSGVIQYVEPNSFGEIETLETSFSSDEIDKFKKLIDAVWTRIINLDMPDISKYNANYKGVLAFEQDLIDGTI